MQVVHLSIYKWLHYKRLNCILAQCWHTMCEDVISCNANIMTHSNPRDVCEGRKKSDTPIIYPGQVLHFVENLERMGGIPWGSVNPVWKTIYHEDTKCGVLKKTSFLQWDPDFWRWFLELPNVGIIPSLDWNRAPPKNVTVIGLMFHPKASGWMFFWFHKAGNQFSQLEDLSNTHKHATKHLHNIQPKISSSFWFDNWKHQSAISKKHIHEKIKTYISKVTSHALAGCKVLHRHLYWYHYHLKNRSERCQIYMLLEFCVLRACSCWFRFMFSEAAAPPPPGRSALFYRSSRFTRPE